MRDRFPLLLVCIALLGGCNDSTSGPDTRPATREEFIARVDAVCSDRSNAIKDLEPPRNLEESAPFLRKVLPVMREQLNRIRALGEPPQEGAETYFEWLEARDGVLEATAKMIDAAEERDGDRFYQLAGVQQQLDEKADEAAAAYGFEVCGVSGAEDISEDAE